MKWYERKAIVDMPTYIFTCIGWYLVGTGITTLIFLCAR